LATPTVFDAGSDAFNFTDNAAVLTNVVINNFTSDDSITTNAEEIDYSFNNDGTDMLIIFNNQGTINDILLTGVVSSDAFVSDQASFTAAIGFDAFTS
jgi:predicted DNA-binding ArsR family transcriptional regulator